MFSFGRKPKKQTFALFDIGSGTVGGAYVTVGGEKPVIHYTLRKPFRHLREPRFDRLVREMIRTFDEVTDVMTRRGSKGVPMPITGAACILAAPWHISETKTLHFKRKESFVVTKELLDRILTRATKRFESSNENVSAQAHLKGAELLERKIIQTKLNGYPTKDPHKRTARTLDVSIFVSLVPSEVRKKLHQAVGRAFHTNVASFHTLALSSYSTIRDLNPEREDFLLVDVGAEMTEILLVRDGVLLESVSYPLGRTSVLRLLASEHQSTPEEAESTLRLGGVKSTKGVSSHIVRKLDSVKAPWQEEFAVSLAQFVAGAALPSQVYLTASTDTSSTFKELIEGAATTSQMATRTSFSVHTLSAADLAEHLNLAKHADYDQFLGLETLFLDRLGR